jgi:predicted KAP-like P-loop ATPase
MTNQVPKSKKNAIEIDKVSPFKNCKLDREKYAQVLTSVVQNYRDGFVLAINNEWGTGKTTFIKMWEQHLKNKKFTTLHFNAWKTDFSSNPFLALISQLGILNKSKTEELYQGFMEKSTVVMRRIVPGLIKGLSKRYIDDSELQELLSIGAEISVSDLEKSIKHQFKAEKDIDDFRDALKKLVKEASSEKPIVFIIDELDRCRPDYAIAVLEQIKHFFAIDGIVFVLAIDKEQLGHAVRGVYGSDRINADEYLRRFIDLEYSLPEPEYKDYCAYLYDYYNFDEFLASEQRLGYQNLSDEREHFVKFTSFFLVTINQILDF